MDAPSNAKQNGLSGFLSVVAWKFVRLHCGGGRTFAAENCLKGDRGTQQWKLYRWHTFWLTGVKEFPIRPSSSRRIQLNDFVASVVYHLIHELSVGREDLSLRSSFRVVFPGGNTCGSQRTTDWCVFQIRLVSVRGKQMESFHVRFGMMYAGNPLSGSCFTLVLISICHMRSALIGRNVPFELN